MLRLIRKTDLPAVIAIEQATQASPWQPDVFKRCMDVGYPCWVIERDAELVGFILVSSGVDEGHILNICVSPSHQRQGIGSMLLQHALSSMKKQGAHFAYLEVRRSNKGAIALYEKEGFVQIGDRKNYYPAPKGREDALIFARDLRVDD